MQGDEVLVIPYFLRRDAVEKRRSIEAKFTIGTQIKIGSQYSKEHQRFSPGEIITLIEGAFGNEKCLYTKMQAVPAIWCNDTKVFDSIYHLFGNEFENFSDCEVVESV